MHRDVLYIGSTVSTDWHPTHQNNVPLSLGTRVPERTCIWSAVVLGLLDLIGPRNRTGTRAGQHLWEGPEEVGTC